MTRDSERPTTGASRRKFIALTGTAGAMALAGCSGTSGDDTTDGNGNNSSSNSNNGGGSSSNQPLTADGSSTVYPITSQAGSLWNGNAPASDGEYWGSSDESSVPGWDDIQTDKNMADYWAGLYDFEPSGEEGTPPFYTSIGLNHTGVGLTKLEKGQVDIGDASAPVSAEFPNRSESELEPFTDHIVAVDAQPIVVSRQIYDAGVEKLTLKQLQQIYRGEIQNWSEFDGPDKEIQAVGRAEGSGTDTSFRANVLGDPDADMGGTDVRKGQNQQVAALVENSDNAIAYIALAFVEEDGPVAPLALEIEGTTYTYGDNLGSLDYPLSRALHCYTWEGTSNKEAAFIRMILHEYGQKMFVEPANYLTLTDEERQKQLDKLPEPTNQ
ncbi:PstS family phosphate ABC transporter substrate-binding protein [Haladaptatus cibarius]|uniref:PstS family phosphate ABC transporter substrate-binding protein n=1 Tax=Haladaptatus cibarius TaxID=453847 RepID=UPI000678C7B0|nr:substrate-binding domain-containing protein [Haladaptatus cibarius]